MKKFYLTMALIQFFGGLGLALSQSTTVLADAVCTTRVIDWATLGWDETNTSSTEVNTYFDESIHNKNPFHGLGSSSGGISGFLSQSFINASGSGVDIDVYYSHNMHDQTTLDTPNLYGGDAGANPDARVTGSTALRFTRDYNDDYTHGTHGSVRSPASIVYNFSTPVFINELILASLSNINDYENVVVRAFDGPDATGSVVKASAYNNISDLDDDSTLLHGLGDGSAPIRNNVLSNVNLDPDNTFDVSGDGTNIGAAADDGIYHTIGAGAQSGDNYGRVLHKYENTPIQSIAVSTWTTTTATGFTEDIYTSDFHSAIFAPVSFCMASHDYGDAPDGSAGTGAANYNTVGTDTGAVHEIDTDIRIGALVDADNSLLQNGLASNDDSDGTDDEDGVLDLGELNFTDSQESPMVNVSVYNNMGESATLFGWIDYNGDGVFDSSTERASIPVPDGTNGTVKLTFPDVPGNSFANTGGSSYMRLRLSTDSSPSSSAIGAVANGEVEDYVVSFQEATPEVDDPEEDPSGDELAATGSSTMTQAAIGALLFLSALLLAYRPHYKYENNHEAL